MASARDRGSRELGSIKDRAALAKIRKTKPVRLKALNCRRRFKKFHFGSPFFFFGSLLNEVVMNRKYQSVR